MLLLPSSQSLSLLDEEEEEEELLLLSQEDSADELQSATTSLSLCLDWDCLSLSALMSCCKAGGARFAAAVCWASGDDFGLIGEAPASAGATTDLLLVLLLSLGTPTWGAQGLISGLQTKNQTQKGKHKLDTPVSAVLYAVGRHYRACEVCGSLLLQ
jgi:hypothetical protein